jgi:amidophosphoribosyltransferase
MRSIGEKCAVFGIYGKGLDVSRLTFFGLYALQHRGQESSGIASTDGKKIFCYKNNGLVSQVFSEDVIKSLKGHAAVGHNRYSTSSGGDIKHAQPIEVSDGSLVLVHNGNLPTTTQLTNFLKKRGVDTAETSDSKLITEAIYSLTRDGV